MPNSERISTRKALRIVLTTGFTLLCPLGMRAAALNACDLNADGVVNVVDVQLATNMTLGTAPCIANIAGADVCNAVVIQRIINAVLSGNCVTGGNHSVTLNWTASTSVNVTGYNIYRGAKSGGPYSKVNAGPVVGTSYTDSTVQAGETYYYVASALDSNTNESTYSDPASATVPSP